MENSRPHDFEAWKKDLLRRAEEYAATRKSLAQPETTTAKEQAFSTPSEPEVAAIIRKYETPESGTANGKFEDRNEENNDNDEKRYEELCKRCGEVVLHGGDPTKLFAEMNVLAHRLGTRSREIDIEIGRQILDRMSLEQLNAVKHRLEEISSRSPSASSSKIINPL